MILATPFKDIEYHRKYKDPNKNHYSPVKAHRGHWCRNRPEGPEEGPGRIRYRCNVDRNTPFSQRELRRRQAFGVTESSPEN